MGEEAVHLGHADADGKRGSRDQRVALVQTALAQHGHAGDNDGAEHDDRAAAQYAGGQRGEEGTDGREQTGDHQSQSAEHNGEAVDHLGHGHQTHVLTEGGNGSAAEQAAGDRRDKAVAAQGAGQLLFRDVPAQAAGADGGGVADGLSGGDEKHQRDRHDGAQLELGGVMQQHGQGDDAQLLHGGADGGEVHHAEADGGDVAHHQAEEDIELLPEALGQGLEYQTGHQCDGAHRQVLPAAEVIDIGGTVGVDAHAQQGEADGCHHAGGDDGGHEPPPVFDGQTQHAFDTAADDDGADHHAVVPGRHHHHGGDEGEADAHDYRQARTYFPDGIQLN